MAEQGELAQATLADVIIASGAADAPADEAMFLQAARLHEENMQSEAELLERREKISLPGDVVFSIQPNARSTGPLVARLVEAGGGAEEVFERRPVTPEDPFLAQRYTARSRPSQAPIEGRLEFARDFRPPTYTRMEGRALKGVVQMWVVSIAIRKLDQADIEESRDGTVLAQWVDGRIVPITGGPAPARS